MSRTLTDLQKSTWYYVIAFVLVLVASLAAGRLGVDPGLGLMFTPLISVFAMFFILTRDGLTRQAWSSLGLHRLGFRSWGLALLGPIFVLAFAYAVGALLGIVRLTAPGPSFITNFPPDAIAMAVGMSVLGSFGEEIGWRGYFLPRLLSLGRTRALLLSGLLHGVFHLPFILLTPFYHGQGNKLIVVPLFLLALTAAGVFYGYLRLTSQSVWPAAIAHTSINITAEQLAAVTVAASPLAGEYLLGESGLLTIIALVIGAAWLLSRLNRVQPATPVS